MLPGAPARSDCPVVASHGRLIEQWQPVRVVNRYAFVALLSLCIVGPAPGQDSTKTFTYTKTKQADLQIVVHFPPDWKETDKRPGSVFFFGNCQCLIQFCILISP